jgi:hypothetical protein
MNGDDFEARIPAPTSQRRLMVELACWYHSRTEWFDRLHCVADDGHWRAGPGGGAMPLTSEQRARSNQHAAACLRAVGWMMGRQQLDAVQFQQTLASVSDWTLLRQQECANGLGPPILDVLDEASWAAYWDRR